MNDDTNPATSVAEILARAGLDREVVGVRSLGGGVSSDVRDVETTVDRLVMKVALPQLRVPDEWLAPVSRAEVERKALILAAGRTPGSVPAVLGWDQVTGALVLEHAGVDLVPWKSELLAGRAHPEVGPELAGLLVAWQDLPTAALSALGPESSQNFDALRIDPFYRAVAVRIPELAGPLATLVDDCVNSPECLVHGDLSPKNVLVGQRTVVLDWEVAHVGDSAFDAGFLASHLLLKAIARPDAGVEDALDGFTRGLTSARAAVAWERVWRHAGALMLSRLVGKSRVDYLSPDQAAAAALVGRRLLTGHIDDAPRGQELLTFLGYRATALHGSSR